MPRLHLGSFICYRSFDLLSTRPREISAMASHTLPAKVSAETLHKWLSSSNPPAVVDVRDSDRFGGHIRNSINAPSTSFTKDLDKLSDQLREEEVVVFHCQLSQQRGPHCAKIYAKQAPEKQQVYILEGGFSNWARKYPKDSQTEALIGYLYLS